MSAKLPTRSSMYAGTQMVRDKVRISPLPRFTVTEVDEDVRQATT